MRREGSRWAAPDRRATLEADGPRGARLRSIASAEQPVFCLSHRWSGGPSRITNGPDGWGPPRLASARSTRQCWGMLGSTGTDVARVLHASVSWTFCLSEKLPTSADSGLRITCAAAAVAVCHPRASGRLRVFPWRAQRAHAELATRRQRCRPRARLWGRPPGRRRCAEHRRVGAAKRPSSLAIGCAGHMRLARCSTGKRSGGLLRV